MNTAKHRLGELAVAGLVISGSLAFAVAGFSYSWTHPGLTQMEVLQALPSWPFWRCFFGALTGFVCMSAVHLGKGLLDGWRS